MVDAFRSMLDELMGKERDAPLGERSNRRVHFTDRDVCKYELAGVCPHRLFTNTRSDLGPCPMGEIHADHIEWDQIKGEFDRLDEREKERHGFEKDLVRYLESLIRDMDRKIDKNRERAAAESRPRPLRPEDTRKLDEVKARLEECLQRSMEMGEAGDVDGSMAMAQQADVYKRQHEALLKQLTTPDRFMSVCDVCGIFISSMDDAAGRKLSAGELRAREEHLSGKQYLGWKKVRDTFKELTEKRRSGGGGGGGGGGDHSRERARSGGRSRSRSRERRRSPGRRDGDGGGGYERGSYERGGYERGGYSRGPDRGGGGGGGGYDRDRYERERYEREYRRDRRY